MNKLKFKKAIMTSPLLRHRKSRQINVTRFLHWSPPNQNFWLRQCNMGIRI